MNYWLFFKSDFYEYAALHSFMEKLNEAFQKHDINKNGALDLQSKQYL